MKILVACEYSGIVRDAFIAKGHTAISCDILPTESPGPHYQGDVIDILYENWDMIIAHPPCTYLCNSGVRWLYEKPGRWEKLDIACDFYKLFLGTNCKKVCIENPKMHKHAKLRINLNEKNMQYIQPNLFGHPEKKLTGLNLIGLPKLKPKNIVEPQYIVTKDGKKYSRLHYLSNNNKKERSKIRSKTFIGIANAMAEQWG